jgi:hypothetical protein
VLAELVLDDLKFQQLVSEARTRIVRRSPEWTEHNVSDPGITLIEAFAWLTEILVYRTDRFTDRLHGVLLELLGVAPGRPAQARTQIRFMLDEGVREATVPAATEVAAPRAPGESPVVFRTVEDLTISGGRLSPRVLPGDDVVLLGFEQSLDGLVIRLEIETEHSDEPEGGSRHAPLLWDASGPSGQWREAVAGQETAGQWTDGGAITVELPAQTGIASIEGHRMHWLRCRVAGRARDADTPSHAWPPPLRAVTATVVGASVGAVHALSTTDESLGTSRGLPGVTYPLKHRPVLALQAGETLEVREPGDDRWVSWQPVSSFADSGRSDRHFMLDEARGEVRFGPAVRQPDGGWRQFGAIPSAGSALRFSRYRSGGGRAGNVAARALSVMPAPIADIAGASNRRPATGGVDAEPLESADRRAALELKAHTRAVTAEDFERLTIAAAPEVARAICVAPAGSGPIRVHVLAHVAAADRRLTLEELTPSQALMALLASTLEQHRLIGTSIHLLPVRLRGVSVAVDVLTSSRADPARVQQDIAHALYSYLNPLIGGSPEGPGAGWPVGRALNQGELFGIVYSISGVEVVNILRTYETDLRTGEQAARPIESRLVLEPGELIASGEHIVRVSTQE